MARFLALDVHPRRLITVGGQIVGISDSLQGLRDAGFDAATYTGNRLVQLSDNQVPDLARVGWKYEVSGQRVVEVFTPTAIETLQQELRTTHLQLMTWRQGLDDEAAGQPLSKVQVGHSYIYRALGSLYLIGTNSVTDSGGTATPISVADRTTVTRLIRFGAADITSVHAFYQHFSGEARTNWTSWVTPLDSTAARVNLNDAVVVHGTVPDTVVLTTTAWVTGVTS